MENYTEIKIPPKTAKKPVFAYLARVLVVVMTLGVSAIMVNRYIFRSKATADVATVTFTPRTHSVSVNEEFSQGVSVNTGEKKVSGIQLVIRYNSEYLEYVPAANIPSLPEAYFTHKLAQETLSGEGTAKTLKLVLVANKPDAELLGSVTVNLKFKAIKKKDDAAWLTLDETASVIVGTTGSTELQDHQFDIDSAAASARVNINETLSCVNDGQCGNFGSCNGGTCSCQANHFNCDNVWTNGCESTVACPNTGNVSVKLSVKLQGVTETPKSTDNIKVKIDVVGQGGNKQSVDNITLNSVSNKGVFEGTASLPTLVAGQGFQVFVKGPKHVKKRFCTASPAGVNYHCTGNETITLTSGQNVLDFSQVPLLAGDLPLPQDGVLNSKDVTAFKQCFLQKTADCLNKADLNYDGAVNASDWSIMVASMGVVYDDEN